MLIQITPRGAVQACNRQKNFLRHINNNNNINPMKHHRSLWASLLTISLAISALAFTSSAEANDGPPVLSSGSVANAVGGAPATPASTAGESLNKARKEDDDETAYQLRVLDEQEKLDEKLAALSAFTKSAKFLGLPENQRILLERQQSVMAKYSQILRERIALFA